MLIDLSEILMQTGRTTQKEADIEFDKLHIRGEDVKVIKKEKMQFMLKNLAKNVIELETEIKLTLSFSCNRCLDEVRKDFDLKITKEIDMTNPDSEEQEFMENNFLDVDILVTTEIVPELPMKVLCNENCKGICRKCGNNLNKKECNCDRTELDPRMAKILDIFNEYKEV